MTASLLDEPPGAELAPVEEGGPGPRARLAAFESAVRARIAAAWRRRWVRIGAAAAALLAAGAAAWAVYDRVRVEPPPDYRSASLDIVLEYTLLTDDFNRLPLEQRLELLRELIKRLTALEGGDSVAMAMFASVISGPAREQLEKNVSLLAVDLFDSYAADYDAEAPEAERGAFLEAKFLEFEKTMESLTGETRDISDEERLARAQRSARRDMKFVQDGGLAADQMMRVFDLVNNGVGQHASGHQKLRIGTMMRDMTWTLRRGGAEAEAAAEPGQPPAESSAPAPAPASND